jgi:chromate reductase
MAITLFSFSGSVRKKSYNTQLAQLASRLARAEGVEVQDLNLADYPLPIFSEDLESEKGSPEGLAKLKEMFMTSSGFILSSPEYNGSLSPLLKNTIDWLSRPYQGKNGLACFQGKIMLMLAASPGRLGGLRGMLQLRTIMSGIGTLVLPQDFALANAHEAFASDGSLKDTKQQETLKSAVGQWVRTVTKLGG